MLGARYTFQHNLRPSVDTTASCAEPVFLGQCLSLARDNSACDKAHQNEQ
jgi:hypothetical protein